jgi:hypothetical protein
MPFLEELILETDDDVCDVVESFSSVACQMMPKLKIFCSNGFNGQLEGVAPFTKKVSNVNLTYGNIHHPCALEECQLYDSSIPGL